MERIGEMDKILIMIPALNPDGKLIQLLAELKQEEYIHILIINDGSKEEYNYIFELAQNEYKCIIINNQENLGKGMALKKGFSYVLEHCHNISTIVTVDADGQHLIQDIKKVSNASLENTQTIIMGCRNFTNKKQVPLRSRLGNVITRKVFMFWHDIRLMDTQTGLRAIPKIFLEEFMLVEGERYEYETNMLIRTKELGIKLYEVAIETVYIENNQTSYFNPLKDSMRIYALLIPFSIASIISFLTDISLFQIGMKISGGG